MKRILLFSAVASIMIGAMAQSNDSRLPESQILIPTALRVNPMAKSPIRAEKDLNAWYMPPLICQYYGIDKVRSYYRSSGIEVYPANEYLEWMNLSDNADGTVYTWTYVDPETGELTESNDFDLNITYDLNKLNTIIDGMDVTGTLIITPKLAAGEGLVSVGFESCQLMQIGGAARQREISPSSQDYVDYGLLPFDVVTDGLMTYAPDGVPVFGYSPESKDWMTNLVFNDDPGDNYAYCNAIFNTIIPAETPLSVRGARFFARGKLHDDAVLKFEIYPTTEEGEFVYEPIAVAECPVSDMIVTPDGDMNIYEIPFMLANEIELSSETSPYYLVGVTGFYGAAEWFAPYQSERPNQYELALGYYRCTVNYAGEVDDWWMWHVANFENEYGEMYSTFAICLDAAYPWNSDPWTTGIDTITTDRKLAGQCFDLQGRKVSPNQHGIVIRDGEKVLRR